MGLFDGFLGDVLDPGRILRGQEPKQLSGGSITSAPTLTPEQLRLMNQTLLPFLGSRGLEGLRDAPAPLSATGPTDLGQTSLEALEQQALAIAGGEGAAETADVNRGVLRDIATRGPQDIEKFFSQVIQEPLVESFERDVLPRIGRGFGGNQFFGSERREADSRAREDLIDSLVRSKTEVGFTARQQDTENALAAIGASGGNEALVPQIIAQLLGAGETVRGQETELLGAEREEELRARGEKDKVIEQILAALDIQGTENVVFPPVFSGGSSGQAGGVAGGVAAIFCDRRLKRNILFLTVIKGIPLYLFRYLWSVDWHVGPMAQDLLVLRPEVVTPRGGILTVRI